MGLYWDIIGRLLKIPTLEKGYKYQCWYTKHNFPILENDGLDWKTYFVLPM